MKSELQLHLERWRGCVACPLHLNRDKMVFARGKVPCDILFIGEAPGASENSLGVPFIGPAGKLLDRIVAASVPPGIRMAFTNLVCCIPLLEDGSKKADEPPPESIRACEPRLVEFVRIARPRLIVLVGKLARKYVYGQATFAIDESGQPEWIPEGRFLGFVEVAHPAFILRSNIAQQGLLIQQSEVRIANAVEDMLAEDRARSGIG